MEVSDSISRVLTLLILSLELSVLVSVTVLR